MKDSIVSINSTLEKIGNADLGALATKAGETASAAPQAILFTLIGVAIFALMYAIIYYTGAALVRCLKYLMGRQSVASAKPTVPKTWIGGGSFNR